MIQTVKIDPGQLSGALKHRWAEEVEGGVYRCLRTFSITSKSGRTVATLPMGALFRIDPPPVVPRANRYDLLKKGLKLQDSPSVTQVMEFHIGQVVYLSEELSKCRLRDAEFTVAKVGRKWIECSNGDRFDKQTLQIDGGQYSSPGFAYLTKEAFYEKVELKQLWSALGYAIHYGGPPTNVTPADIRSAAEVLKLTLKPV